MEFNMIIKEMLKVKNLIAFIVLASLARSATAADDLKIANSSENTLTLSASESCSEEIDRVNAHSIKVVSEKYLKNCKIFVYSTENCSGQPIAILVFDKKGGVTGIKIPLSSSYH